MSEDWQPPGPESYSPREERAPIGRAVAGLLLLGVIGLGAIWLAMTVLVPKELPTQEPRESEQSASTDTPKPAEDDGRLSEAEAWIRALEMDTLEGYREYLALFPNGRNAPAAQAEIDVYDDAAWDIALQRNTIAGFEDYLEAWPEGRHASEARERIEAMQAEADAIAEDAAERASQEAADWETASRENTIESYGRYLTKHPAGPNADEAQRRINRIQAEAADRAAWQQAQSLGNIPGYEAYLSAFPSGAFVMQATAAIEALRPSPGRTFKDCDTCPLMVSLPSGQASLGAAAGEALARPSEGPARPVIIPGLFAMSVHEVTFDDWRACVSDGACSAPGDNGWGAGRRPVINVSWDDAQAYVSWLSDKTGQRYSLPSEAQWEYAARGGESGAYVGGSLVGLCAFANGASSESGVPWANGDCADPAADRTMPVGTLSANAFGLRDMIGNVAEWTLDCNTLNLRDAPTDGSADLRGSCGQRAVRGGSWFSGPADLRFAARSMQRRGDRNDFTGFRLVRQIP